MILLITSVFSFKTAIEGCKSGIDNVISWFTDKNKNDNTGKKENIVDITLSVESEDVDESIIVEPNNEVQDSLIINEK